MSEAAFSFSSLKCLFGDRQLCPWERSRADLFSELLLTFQSRFFFFLCVCVRQIYKQIVSWVFSSVLPRFVYSDADWKGFTIICRHTASVDGIVNRKDLAFNVWKWQPPPKKQLSSFKADRGIFHLISFSFESGFFLCVWRQCLGKWIESTVCKPKSRRMMFLKRHDL